MCRLCSQPFRANKLPQTPTQKRKAFYITQKRKRCDNQFKIAAARVVLGSEMEVVDLARELGIKDSTLRHGGIIVSEKRALAVRRGVGQCRSCLAGIVCQTCQILHFRRSRRAFGRARSRR